MAKKNKSNQYAEITEHDKIILNKILSDLLLELEHGQATATDIFWQAVGAGQQIVFNKIDGLDKQRTQQ